MAFVRDRRVQRFLLVVLTILYVLFIYSNSLRDGTASSNQSGRITELLQSLLSSFGWQGTVSEHFLRKLAHFAEYAGLGVLLGFMLRTFTPHLLRQAGFPLFVGLLVPVSDEFLQLFVAGRAGMVQDVVLDFLGMLTGFSLTVGLLLLFARRKRGRDEDTEQEDGQ